MTTLRCRCGELYHVDEASVGRKLHCRKCGRIHVIRLPPRAPAAPSPPPPTPPKSGSTPLRAGARRLAELGARLRGGRPTRLHGGRPTRLRRWALILSLAYLAGALLAALLLWGWSDAWWPATFLLFSGRWVLLLPLVALVPLALSAMDARALAALAVAALVVLFPVMGLQLDGVPSKRAVFATPGHLRVVTFNTGNSRRVALDLPQLLEEWDAHVVAMQECGTHVAEAATSVEGWYRHVPGGSLCLLSRYPIEAAETMDRTQLDGVRQASMIGGAGFVVRYTIRLPGGPLRLTNLHLETPRKGFEGVMRGDMGDLLGNTQLRAIEARLASRWANDAGAVDVVAGDFNTPVESRIYRSAWGALTNAFSAAGNGFGYTRHNGWVRVRIDHVLVGRGWRPLRAVVGDDSGSDHRPLIVDLAPSSR